ncbi:hypothetical protein BGLY_3340 [Bacillus glycinifermentans]|nr:hypothetical protein BGLY_3340 [Bacillus glycinifermentans]
MLGGIRLFSQVSPDAYHSKYINWFLDGSFLLFRSLYASRKPIKQHVSMFFLSFASGSNIKLFFQHFYQILIHALHPFNIKKRPRSLAVTLFLTLFCEVVKLGNLPPRSCLPFYTTDFCGFNNCTMRQFWHNWLMISSFIRLTVSRDMPRWRPIAR